jgi:MFS family permease
LAWRPVAVFAVLSSAFVLLGLTVSAPGVLWAELLPQLGLGTGVFGTIQLVSPLLSIVLLLFGGQLAARFGKRSLAIASVSLLAAWMVALAASRGPWGLVAALAVAGLANGLFETAMNGGAIDWEAATGRQALNVMHAAFGGGLVVGALGTGFLREAGWQPPQILLLIAAIGGCVVVGLLPLRFPPAAAHNDDIADPMGTIRLLFGRHQMRVLALIAILGAFCENLAFIWSVIYLEQRGADLALGSSAFALFGITMMAGRLANAATVVRFGARFSLRLSGTGLVIAGILLVLADGPTTAVAGLGLLGLAVAGVVPTALGAAALLAPGRSGAVAGGMLAALYFSFMASAPLIGWLAELVTLRFSLTTVALCGLGILLLSRPTSLFLLNSGERLRWSRDGL